MNHKLFPVSFEVFPPKTEVGLSDLRETCLLLGERKPEFISVTFGAACKSQDQTIETASLLSKDKHNIAPHLTCVGMTMDRLKHLLEVYQKIGINRLVVIRGDFPKDKEVISDFNYAADLIAEIRNLSGNQFHIAVAAYPEGHPECLSYNDDLHNFKNKVDAGADSAITQFFFNTDAYERFREDCASLDIKIPIIPGIMPIHSFDKLQRFAKLCGAEIPLWLKKKMDDLANDPEAVRSLGIELVTKICERLLGIGAEGLHFYTLNQAQPSLQVHDNLFPMRTAKHEVLNMLYV